MKYVVFSDVHGNQYALRQMIQDTVPEADGYLYLGDTSGYYYGQQECMKLLRNLPNAVLLRGNHDIAYLNSRMQEQAKQELAARYGNSYLQEQSGTYLQWLKGLQSQMKLEINRIRVGMFHGSPQDAEKGRCYPDTPLDAEAYASYDVVFQGHTHYRMARMAGDTLVLNPGSLGQPRDGQGFSYCIIDFCMFEIHKPEFIFRTVRFDKGELFREIEEHKETEKNEAYLTSVLIRGNNG